MRLFRRKLRLRRSLVPEGYFLMGSDAVDTFDEGPVHRVYIAAFEMAQYPVTNAEYAVFVRQAHAEPPPFSRQPGFAEAELPVVGVSWHDARAYCGWLSAETGHNVRLPTEAEFEKAARSGLAGCEYPWGNDRAKGGYRLERGPLSGPYRSGLNPANAYGLYDLVSNVFQWCQDGYDPRYYRESSERNPQGPEDAERRVARGASFKRQDLIGRCAERTGLAPYFRVDDFGFRWVIGYELGKSPSP